MADEMNRGFLMKNKKHVEGDKLPHYTGKLAANGIVFQLAAWVSKTEDGKKFLAIRPELMASQEFSPWAIRKAEEAKRAKESAQAAAPETAPAPEDDDMPF